MSEDTVKFSDVELSLAQLANIDLSEVKEKRFAPLPRLTGVFVVDGEKAPEVAKMGEKAGVAFSCKLEEVLSLKEMADGATPEELLGRVHRETFFLGDDEAFGYLVAFLNDIGVGGKGKLSELLMASVGKRFQASIGHRKNPNDTDRPYINFIRDKGKIVALG